MEDTGVKTFGKTQAGRWVTDMKEGRKRNLHIYMADRDTEDQSYIGYFSNKLKASVGCNLALSIEEKEVCIQFVNPKTNQVVIKSVETSKFMDLLDGILDFLS